MDIERFALLCESIDRHVRGYEKHYVIVNDDDVPLFARFISHRRIVVSARNCCHAGSSSYLPCCGKGRRVLVVFRTKPVHGWHIQQILKIAAVLRAPEQQFCIIDSDNVFIRAFDVKNYAGGEKTPLYVERAAISAEAPLHATWTGNSVAYLGGRNRSCSLPTHYVGNLIVWDKTAVQDMTRAIEGVTNKAWAHALCRTRDFSEYLLYGHVRNSQRHLAHHEIITESLANAYWGYVALNYPALTAMVDSSPRF